MPQTQNHFTAIIDINETINAASTDYHSKTTQDRIVKDITKLIVRADSLEELKQKIAAHIAII